MWIIQITNIDWRKINRCWNFKLHAVWVEQVIQACRHQHQHQNHHQHLHYHHQRLHWIDIDIIWQTDVTLERKGKFSTRNQGLLPTWTATYYTVQYRNNNKKEKKTLKKHKKKLKKSLIADPTFDIMKNCQPCTHINTIEYSYSFPLGQHKLLC